MAVSISAVMRHVKNFFARGCMDGEFTVSGGKLTPAPASPYIAVSGSSMIDGAYAVGELPFAAKETFTGRVWLLYPPEDFLALCEQISKYDDANPAGAMQSESFGDYTYRRASVGMNGSGGVASWQTAFAIHLNPYRRMYTEVDI